MERSTALVPVNANVRNGWLSGETTQQQLASGETLRSLAERCFDPALEPFLVAQINGDFKADWKNYVPLPDDHVLVYVLPQGSGGNNGGKSALMLVAAVVVAAVAPAATGGITSALGASDAVASVIYAVGTSVVMAALSRALFKPPSQTLDTTSAVNPFYSLSGATNAARPFGAVPNIYGRIRFTPAQVVPADKLYLSDGIYLIVLLDFGYGHLHISDIKVGKSDLANHTPDYKVHSSFTKDTPLQWFKAVNRPADAGNALVDKQGVIRTTAKETKELSIELSFPTGLWGTSPYDGKQRSEAVNYLIECRKKGDSNQTWRSIWDFAIPSAPDNADQPRPGNEPLNFVPNWQPYVWSAMRMNVWDNGLTGDAKVTFAGFRAGVGFSDISGDFFTLGGYPPPSRGRIIDPRGNFVNNSLVSIVPGYFTRWAIRFDNPWPQDIILRQWNGANPPVASAFDSAVPWYGLIFNFGPSYPPFGQNYPFYTYGYWEGAIVGEKPRNPSPSVDTRQNFTMEWRFDFIYAGEYEIRVRNLGDTSPRTDPYINNEIRWTRYTSYSGEVTETFNPDVPHTVLEIRIKATDQTNETVDTISAVAERWLDLYSWKDDAWHFWPTRSPAWAYYDILTGPATKDPVPPHLIDLDAIKAWDEECGALAIGNGIEQPTYCCDLIIQGEATIKDALDAVATTGRAVPCRKDMKHSVIRRPDTDAIPVQLFTHKNTSDLKTTISYLNPPHAIKVSFMDELNDYAINEEIVYHDDYDPVRLGSQALKATVFEELELPGVTQRRQAWQLGRFYFATTLLERERISLLCPMEHLIAQRGDLVFVSSDYLRAGGLPRRITKIEGNHFWFDEPAQGINTLRFRGTDSLVPVSVVSDQEFIIAAGYAQYLIVGDVVEWGVTSQIKAPYLIEDILPGEDYSATVRLLEYKKEVEAAVEGTIPDRVVPPGSVDGFAIGPVGALALKVFTEMDTSGVIWRRYYGRQLTWMPPATGKVDRYNIYQVVDMAYYWVASTTVNNYALKSIPVSDVQKTIEMRYAVEPVVDLRGVGPKAEVAVIINPDITPPADVGFLHINLQTETLTLFWSQFTAVQKADLSHFEIRYSNNFNATWNQASKMVEYAPRDLTAASVPLRIGRYFIKAVDFSGNYSVNAATDITQVVDSSISEMNSVIEFAPFSGGTHDNTYASNNSLRIDPDETEGEYYAPDSKALHFERPARIRLTAAIEVESIAVDALLGGGWFSPLADAIPLSGPSQQVLDKASAQIYFRYMSESTDLNYTQWDVLTMADVTASDVEFKVMMMTPDSAVTASVVNASVQSDWIQRLESVSHQEVGTGNKVISFQNEFALAPAINVTILNAQLGDWAQVGVTNSKSFTVTLFDSNNVWKPGYISWTAKGYGKLF